MPVLHRGLPSVTLRESFPFVHYYNIWCPNTSIFPVYKTDQTFALKSLLGTWRIRFPGWSASAATGSSRFHYRAAARTIANATGVDITVLFARKVRVNCGTPGFRSTESSVKDRGIGTAGLVFVWPISNGCLRAAVARLPLLSCRR